MICCMRLKGVKKLIYFPFQYIFEMPHLFFEVKFETTKKNIPSKLTVKDIIGGEVQIPQLVREEFF